ncbi:hypothetical protein J2857_005271 [Neorhizobium galegae]|uniref:hypothetical protein n=1 Tax=Neorhizobium galegae TaxID=399 RepID=UPI001AEACCF8|nr:hypothetical protein [Neorhizobium galegae]MBP2562480.1 hypothetical protein [Neorhizobium galegae]
MKILIAALIACSAMGCTQTTRYVTVPGHAYKTDPACKRSQPPSKFDERCDCPKLGIKNFTPPNGCWGA